MRRRRFLFALAGLPAWPVAATASMTAASVTASAPATRITISAAAAAASGSAPVEFPPVLPGRTLVFPADHGAHPQYRTEWWYATGWLALPGGSPLGFQVTFFRVRTGIADASASAFAPRQLILAHAAIADPRLGHLLHDQRSARVAPGRAGFDQSKTGVRMPDWRLEQQGDTYQATVSARDFSYSLTLTPRGAPLLNGSGGFSKKGPAALNASYYYSRPQLGVSGTVTLNGRREQVSGHAWLDHEWSSELLPAAAQGWDWVGLNLDDGGSLMAFRVRNREGQALWAAGTAGMAGGASRSLATDEVGFEPMRYWVSARTGIRYPVAWTLLAGGRTLVLTPLMDDQELDSRRSTGTVYWEGAVRVNEADRQIGRGYLELTGYGEKIRVG